MRDSELLIDVMLPNTIYTISSLKRFSPFTVQKTAVLLKRLVEKGKVLQVNFDSEIAKQVKFNCGYMLKGWLMSTFFFYLID